MLIYELIIFFLVYFICGLITPRTNLAEYNWFFKLYSSALEASEPKFWHRVVLFKLFVCASCQTFWISLLLGYLINCHIEYFYIQYALITYLIKKDQDHV